MLRETGRAVSRAQGEEVLLRQVPEQVVEQPPPSREEEGDV